MTNSKIIPLDITVNTKPYQWDEAFISYEDVVSLAGHNPKYIFSVAYHGEIKFDDRLLTAQGTLCPGQKCRPLGGMHFSCYDTSNA